MKKGTKRSQESIEKQRKTMSGSNHWAYGKSRSEETKEKLRIANIGKTYDKIIGEKRALKLMGQKRTLETRIKMSKSSIGKKCPWAKHNLKPMKKEEHWNWQGGKSSKQHIIRTSKEYELWRQTLFLKYDFTCQKCFIRGGKLHTHHIINVSTDITLAINIENGIVLCCQCHKDFHKKYGLTKNNIEQLTQFMGLK